MNHPVTIGVSLLTALSGIVEGGGTIASAIGKSLFNVGKGLVRSGSGTVRGGTTAIHQVGSVLESVDDVFANPSLLKNQTPAQVQGTLDKTSGWKVETLGKGSHQGY